MISTEYIPLFAWGLAILSPLSIKLFSGLLKHIPLYTFSGKKKALSVYTTIAPIMITIMFFAIGVGIMGKELGLLLMPQLLPLFLVALPICFFIMLGRGIDHTYIVEDDGLER